MPHSTRDAQQLEAISIRCECLPVPTPQCAPADFDIPATARAYAALAAVLAGFAFNALIVLLRDGTKWLGPERLWRLTGVMVGAFFALIVSSLTYAGLSGEPESGGRAASEEIVTGVSLVIAAVLLLFAIVLMIEGVAGSSDHGRQLAAGVRRILVHCFIPIAIYLLGLGAQDYLTVRDGIHHEGSLDSWLWMVPLAVFLASFPIYRLAAKIELPAAPPVAASIGAAAALASAVAFGLMSGLGRCEQVDGVVPWIAFLIASAVMVIFIGLIAARQPDDERHTANHSAPAT
jgi:hypothetical protein